MPPVIETRALTKRYGSRTAVDSLDLSVQPGCVFGLIGPNGSGKTTTLRMLLDIIRPSSGQALVLGVPPRAGGPALRRRIGYVPGDLRLNGRASGRTLLEHFAQISAPVPAGRFETLAERLGLDLSRPVRSLSKGNRQKLGLVQAFMHDPDLLVLDEPTSGLDPLVQREFLEMVAEARAAGRTVLLSSHVLSEIQHSADQVAVLSLGKVVAQGDVASLRLNRLRHVRASVAALPATESTLEKDLAAAGLQGTVTRQEGTAHVQGTLEGGVDTFIKVLSRHRVLDLSVEEPDLEESVLRLYGRPDAADTRPGPA
ncbi:ABC transporter ATP-binding protein [Arthrobacter gandavensis]|uniref:ABC transporter ATP-binding protein n=1 Tax=Arthrobacter gandavensis TaxID=169960 RepID=A0ABP5AGB4_9MICC|nr:ABC transporter ATP-binding protein [Arthrobacter citreus]